MREPTPRNCSRRHRPAIHGERVQLGLTLTTVDSSRRCVTVKILPHLILMTQRLRQVQADWFTWADRTYDVEPGHAIVVL